MKTVEQLLAERGPMLGSSVSAYYREQGISPSAARQRVNRRSENVRALYGLPFPKNTKFLYLNNDFMSPRFFEVLVSTLITSAPAYACAISGIKARGGICLADDWDVVSGSPVRQSKHLASQEILKRLKSVKILNTKKVSGIGECIQLDLNARSGVNFSNFRAQMTLEKIVRDVVKGWAIRMGYSSTDTISTKEKQKLPQFGTVCFDIVGPSYLHSLTQKSKTEFKNGFFVADVIWNDNLSLDEVSYFIRKISTLNHLKKLGKFQSMLVANSFEPEALYRCRSNGIMAVTPDTLLGRDIAQGLNDLLDTLKRAAAISAENPEKIEQLFDRLSIIEGVSGNIRGALFEMLVGHIVKMLYAGSIDIGVMAVDPETSSMADVDIRLVSKTDVVCIECKGHDSKTLIGLDEVKYWLEKQVPIFVASQRNEQRFNQLEKRFEFWTTGSFDDETKNYLENRKSVIKKYKIAWRDGDTVLALAKKIQEKTIFKTIKKYYFEKSTVAIIDRK